MNPIHPQVEPYFIITNLMCGLIFCDSCQRQPQFQSTAPDLSDQRRYHQAEAMHRQGWVILPQLPLVQCPDCATTPTPTPTRHT